MRRLANSVFAALTLATCAVAPPPKMPWSYAARPIPSSAAAATGAGGRGGPAEEETVAVVSLPSRRTPTPVALVFEWPLAATGVNSLFGRRTDPVDGERRFHRGVDIDAVYGAMVAASAGGRVVQAGWSH